MLQRIPPWTFTIIVGALILWLTLGKPPQPDEGIQLWEHTDKIVHACMFGSLFFAIAFDWFRRRPQLKPRAGSPIMWKDCIWSSLAGGGIEIIQPYFDRSADFMDFLADVGGVLLAWLVTPWLLSYLRPYRR